MIGTESGGDSKTYDESSQPDEKRSYIIMLVPGQKPLVNKAGHKDSNVNGSRIKSIIYGAPSILEVNRRAEIYKIWPAERQMADADRKLRRILVLI